MATSLSCRGLCVGYGGPEILHDVDLDIEPGKVTALIGPNGCGKSTLLRALGRQQKPTSGEIILDGEPAAALSARAFARQLSFLPQDPTAPDGVTVREVIGYGRYPYTGAFAALRRADHEAVATAAEQAGIAHLLDEPARALSGGQRQRVFIAMTLAQDTPIVLLDEPTTYLDPAHQLAILDLVASLNEAGKTIVMVVHDMAHAARFADRVIAMVDGTILADGESEEIMTAELISRVFNVECLSVTDPKTGRVLPVPYHNLGLVRDRVA